MAAVVSSVAADVIPSTILFLLQRANALKVDIFGVRPTMSVEEENRWLRSAEFADPTLRRLMELAAQQGALEPTANGNASAAAQRERF